MDAQVEKKAQVLVRATYNVHGSFSWVKGLCAWVEGLCTWVNGLCTWVNTPIKQCQYALTKSRMTHITSYQQCDGAMKSKDTRTKFYLGWLPGFDRYFTRAGHELALS